MALTAGARLGHYDVTSLLGEGGMGQVWQATDTQLNRQVALKILPDAFADDPDRLARFTREAQILASLNHPNIAAIYGIEEAEGTRALVLELVEGPTLADRIRKGPIPLDEALPIAKQIAEALEAAHEAGVIHRDLKPANIKVREDGTVKVLDFGLAKALDPHPEGDPSQSPTLTAAATQMGVILGTAAYMSPEQARGKTVDKRADIWAFGAVLFEMITGRPVFGGDTASETIAGILKSEAAWELLPHRTPRAILDLLHRCLTKDPKRRLRDIGDARIVVSEEGVAPPDGTVDGLAGSRPVARHQVVLLVLMSIVVSSLITGGIVWRATRPAPPPLVRFTVSPGATEELTISPATRDIAISGDGRHIAYLTESGGEQHLWVRSLDQITPTELVAGGLPREPFFSPDNTWLGFYDQTGSVLKRVSVQGGPALTIASVPGLIRGASWGNDDSIIFATIDAGSGLWRVPASGGNPEQLTTPDPERGELDHLWPEILPGAEAVLFTVSELDGGFQIAVLSPETRERRILVQGGSNPRYSPTGHLVYGAQGALRAVRFDLGRLETSGDPVPVLEGVLTKATGVVDFSLSENGWLAYVPTGSVTRGRLVWVDRNGQVTSLFEGEDVYGLPRLSPDGTRVTLGIQSEGGGVDIRIRDFERGSDTRLTVEGTNNIYPVWTPDGEHVTFASSRTGAYDLFSKPADLSGGADLLITTARTKIPGSWSPDGQNLVYYEVHPETLRDIWMLPAGGDPEPFLVTPFNERAPRLSPDGRWMAYVSDQSGEDRVYVQRFPAGGRVIPISTGGGGEAVWSRDGRELFYRHGNQLLAVEVDTSGEFTVGRPSVVFEELYDTDPFAGGNPNYDVSLDGERFLMVMGVSAGATATVTVVQHWFEELKRLVPPN